MWDTLWLFKSTCMCVSCHFQYKIIDITTCLHSTLSYYFEEDFDAVSNLVDMPCPGVKLDTSLKHI